MSETLHAKVFWSGGSQAVRLPKKFRLEGTEVLIRKQGKKLVLEPVPETAADDWAGFWESLKPVKDLKRWKTRGYERRKRL